MNHEPAERPTFRTHMFNKNAQEREKKHSIASTQMTDKTERTEGESTHVIILTVENCL